ncbi:putative aminopeptidase NPEPL1 [Nymphon striatum]|nr:putative aminopeptidase NPEPL1 [Nymphon striatum]
MHPIGGVKVGKLTETVDNSIIEINSKMSPAPVTLTFHGNLSACDPQATPILILGQLKNLKKVPYEDIKLKLEPRVTKELYDGVLSTLHPSPTDSCSLYMNHATLAALPSKCSRHNTPSRAHSITKLVKNSLPGVEDFVVIICETIDVFASACAVARAFPIFNRKTNLPKNTISPRQVACEFHLIGEGSEENLTPSDIDCLTDLSNAIRLSARIVDTPCNEMNTDHFIKEIQDVGKSVGITPTIIRGEKLDELGFGGIYGVGKAAANPPALVILSHTPEGAKHTVAWVGKGIVYDTGGLSLKSRTAMPGMKNDCGGAAAILGAFQVAVKHGFTNNLHAVFCLAENAIGPTATRPDDIHTLYSGRSVEINNTDAEGRLVLGDGVSYAHKDLKANVIVDMATLTGAQGSATGKYHSAVITNSEDWEKAAVIAGKISGDLVHPLPYAPDLHFSEFASAVADMKNSVADRGNAQSSCAALFIASHIGFDYPGVWIHFDIAAPVTFGERATGYGVALLSSLFGHVSSSPFLKSVSALGQPNGNSIENANKKIRLA